MIKFLLPLLLIATQCESARILVACPAVSYSHQIIYQPIWRALAQRGHEVVVITSDPIKDPSLPNLREIDMSFAYEMVRDFDKELHNPNNAALGNIFGIIDLMYNITEAQLKHPEVQTLINNKTEHFDLVMIEYMFPTMFAFKERFNCPFIGIASLDIGSRAHELFGNPRHAVMYPEVILGFPEDINVIHRMASLFISRAFESFMYWRYLTRDDQLIETYFGKGYSSGDDLFASADMVFINSNPVFYKIRPVSPATVYISGGIHIKDLKPLPKDLKTFFDNSKNGVIYFSLGSNVKSKNIPEETKQMLMKVFSELPYDVLWKYEEETLAGKPKNVKITKWAPQQDILRHPKVKLFITQGGMQSLEEALFSGVPMVVIPFMGDQMYNAKQVEEKGMGLVIEDHKAITEEELKSKVLEVIKNPKYKNQVNKLAEFVKDEPMTPLEKAVWWTEYVLRHKGAQHLKSKTIPYYQYYYLDVMAVLGAAFMIIYYTIKSICKCIFRRKVKLE